MNIKKGSKRGPSLCEDIKNLSNNILIIYRRVKNGRKDLCYISLRGTVRLLHYINGRFRQEFGLWHLNNRPRLKRY